jgi:hypothetical protein
MKKEIKFRTKEKKKKEKEKKKNEEVRYGRRRSIVAHVRAQPAVAAIDSEPRPRRPCRAFLINHIADATSSCKK